MESKLLTQEEVAAKLGVHTKTLGNWRERGQGPPWIRLEERLIRYDAAELQAWLNRSREAASP